MPRKKQRGQKSAAIREMLQQDPTLPVREIVSTLAGRGIRVTPNLIYRIKVKARSSRQKQAAQVGRNGGTTNPAQLVLRVKELAAQAGGMNQLKELVEVLAD